MLLQQRRFFSGLLCATVSLVELLVHYIADVCYHGSILKRNTSAVFRFSNINVEAVLICERCKGAASIYF